MPIKRYTLRPFRDIPHSDDKEWQYFAPTADHAIYSLWRDQLNRAISRLECCLDVGCSDEIAIANVVECPEQWQISLAYMVRCGCNDSRILGSAGAYLMLSDFERTFFDVAFATLYGADALDEFQEIALDRLKI